MDDEAVALLAEVLLALWRIEAERPDKPCSPARLSKRAGLPMSALRRQLTLLQEAGLVTLALDEGGVGGAVTLNAAGRALAAGLGDGAADFSRPE